MDEKPPDAGDAQPDDDASSVSWLAITAPLSPVRAAALAAALEQDGIPVTFLEPENHVFPTAFSAQPAGRQQLAVPEYLSQRALDIVSRVNTAFPDTLLTAGAAASASEWSTATEKDHKTPVPPPAETAEDKVFEARRVRRYTEGLFVFVIGLIWTIAVLPRVHTDALLAVVGAITLCSGLLLIYTALSMRKGADGETLDSDEDESVGDV